VDEHVQVIWELWRLGGALFVFAVPIYLYRSGRQESSTPERPQQSIVLIVYADAGSCRISQCKYGATSDGGPEHGERREQQED
jgi:hypothetical protein